MPLVSPLASPMVTASRFVTPVVSVSVSPALVEVKRISSASAPPSMDSVAPCEAPLETRITSSPAPPLIVSEAEVPVMTLSPELPVIVSALGVAAAFTLMSALPPSVTFSTPAVPATSVSVSESAALLNWISSAVPAPAFTASPV